MIRYFEERLRSRVSLANRYNVRHQIMYCTHVQDTLMEKLRLKNSTLRVRKRKLQVQLKQKEEAGEVRHEVDFDQLKIENKQFNEQFEEKNQELLKLKLGAGKTLQVLNSHKVRKQ